MRSSDPIVIVGAGHAGVQLAASMRHKGWDGPISLLNGEPHLPYNRPPLSKNFLKDQSEPESIRLRARSFFSDNGIDLVECRVAQIDRRSRRILSASGSALSYGHLVLATGARNRLLTMPHADHPNVRYLRSVEDALTVRRHLRSCRRVLVVGGGFIGLEFAATAAAQGFQVDIIEQASRFMGRAVSAPVSAFFEKQHATTGCRLHLGRSISSIVLERDGLRGVVLDDGRHLPADLIVVGIGVLPNIEVAETSDLPTRNGIVVDDRLSTCDPNVSALGDCAMFESRRYGGWVRIEAVSNSVDQAKYLAGRLMGSAGAFDAVPWFWSDQGPNKLQIAGLNRAVDQVVLRGDPAERSFSAFCFSSGRLVAVESVNRSGDHMAARRFLAAGIPILPEQAADPDFDLKGASVPVLSASGKFDELSSI